MKLTSYWLDPSEPFRRAAASPVAGRCDVAVDFDWPAIPGHLGPPSFLPLVGAYDRIKDRFQ